MTEIASPTRTGLHLIPVHDLTTENFAPFGQVINPRRALGQWIMPDHNPGTSPDEAQLTLHQGIPRLWIMHLKDIPLTFENMARHMKVTQCLGSLGGVEWLFAVAAPSTSGVRPGVNDVVGFRIPGDRIVKLHIGTWHSGPHFRQSEAQFINLENMNTRREDFETLDLPMPCSYALD